MGESLNPQGTEDREIISGKSMEKLKEASNDGVMDKPKTNGDLSSKPATEDKLPSTNDTKAEPEGPAPTNTATRLNGMDGTSDANPDKPVSTVEDDTAGMLPADPKDETAVSGGAGLAEDTAGLGSILKGSPFEKDEEKKAGTPQSPKTRAAVPHSQPAKLQPKPSANGISNGKGKETAATKPVAQSKPKAPGSTDSAQTKPDPTLGPLKTSLSNGKVKAAAPPIAAKTDSAGPRAQNTKTDTHESHSENTDVPEPRTPVSATTSTKQSTPNKSSPKLGKTKEPKKETTKDTKKPIGRPSAAIKSAPAAASKPSSVTSRPSTKPVKKSTPTSPTSTATKPRPKSPTRPTRLPAAATAPTAASAAKLDGAPPSTNDRKPMNHVSMRDQIHANPTQTQPKPPRTSLPARSKPEEKPKAPKPRQSIASSKAPEGSFLDRMMRPTQSSSQKTHEKVDVKSPPRKQVASKPKRTSEGSNKSKTGTPDPKPEPAKEPAASTDKPSVEPQEEPSSSADPANVSVSAAAHTVPPTIPVP